MGVLLAAGGHGFRCSKPTEMIEVKQGPYSGDQGQGLGSIPVSEDKCQKFNG